MSYLFFLSMSNEINHYVKKTLNLFLDFLSPSHPPFFPSFFPLSVASFPPSSLKSLRLFLFILLFLPFFHQTFIVYISGIFWGDCSSPMKSNYSPSQIPLIVLTTRLHGRQLSGCFLAELPFRVSARQE